MAFQLIPFVAGAVVGGLAAYFARDEKLRREVGATADQVSKTVRGGVGSIRQRLGGGAAVDEAASQPPVDNGAGAGPAPKAVKKTRRSTGARGRSNRSEAAGVDRAGAAARKAPAKKKAAAKRAAAKKAPAKQRPSATGSRPEPGAT